MLKQFPMREICNETIPIQLCDLDGKFNKVYQTFRVFRELTTKVDDEIPKQRIMGSI